MGRHNRKIDGNQNKIVAQLREIPGVSVEPRLARIGEGVPDILVGYKGRNYVFEIKDPSRPKSARKLKPDESVWHKGWSGQVWTVETADEILAAIGILPY